MFATAPVPFALVYQVYEFPLPPDAVKVAVVPQPTTALFEDGEANALIVIGIATGADAQPTLFQEIVINPFPVLYP